MAFRPTGSPNKPQKALPAPRTPLDLDQKDTAWHGGKPPRQGPARAVALEYRPDRGDPRPRIAATGSGAVAEQILQLAFANGIKVREDADLVEILALFEQDSLIPLEALAAVAEILAYVYTAENRAVPTADAPPEGHADRNAAPATTQSAKDAGPDKAVPDRNSKGEGEDNLW